MSRSVRSALLAGALTVCVGLGYALGFSAHAVWRTQGAWGSRTRADGDGSAAVFWEAWDHIERSFYGDLPSAKARTYGAVHESLTLLADPHTVFVEPAARQLERERMSGVFGGIGVTLWRDPSGQVVLSPYRDSPAERAGVSEGDVLLAVAGHHTTDLLTLDEIRAHLHGEAGTTVTITLSRPPTPPFRVSVVREEIEVPSVTWRALEEMSAIGYIRVETFTARTEEEIEEALHQLARDGMRGLVLDLRDNSGGLRSAAVGTASQFIGHRVILYEITGEGETKSIEAAHASGGFAHEAPMAILVNRGTASAAEIVAGALQDWQRGPLVGESTFGKGSVQLIFDLSDGSSLHVTSALWLTPDKRRIEGQGLLPDIRIASSSDLRDGQLDRAVAYLQSEYRLRD